MNWPWKRFERFYESAQKRHLVETLERRKNSMIAALWSNSNFDDDKGTRKQAIDDMEEKCEDAIRIILGGDHTNEEIEEADEYGFFAAGKRGEAKIHQPRDDEGTVRQVIDYNREIDQQ